MELTTLQNIKELGSTVIVAFFGFKTIGDIVKQWIKSKNGKNVTNLKLDDEFEESFKLLLGQVELMNSNHLNSIEKAIRQSSEKTVALNI